MTAEKVHPEGSYLIKYVYLGALQGAAAWSAYAVAEFASSSLLFDLARPYATFTSWHWQLTATLLVAYLAIGLVAGALAGAATWFLGQTRLIRNKDRALVLEGAATLILVIAFALNVAAASFSHTGKPTLLLTGTALAALLVVGMRSARWSDRLGFLTNPWVVAGLLLGVGQGINLLDMQELARQLGVNIALWSALLAGLLIAVAAGAIFLGRWLRPHLSRDRFTMFVPSWAALCLALALIVGSAWLGSQSSAQPPASASTASPSSQPNLVLVVMDTVRADHLSVYGYQRDTTPNLTKLAQDSVLYTEAIAASDITLTSHASLFTGVYASWHGAHCQPPEAVYGRALSPNVPTLAEMLSAKGYSTLGVAANLYLRSDFGLQRGFQSFRIPRPVPVLPDESWYLLRRGIRRGLSYVMDTAQFDRLYSRGEDINHDLFGLLNKQDASRPFFAFLNYMDAHFPYIPPAPYDQLFPGKNRAILEPDLSEMQQRVVVGQPMPAAGLAHCNSQYDSGIAYIDAQIGQLVEYLKQRRLYDNTMIVIASDHGEAFGEKNLVLHGNSAYQNLLHVALLIKYPKSVRTGVEKYPVSLIDVAPTALSALGLPIPPAVQGRNLLQPAARPRRIYSESFPCPVLHTPECAGGCMVRAVYSWPHKFIASSSGKREYFDLSNDAGEDRNLSASERPAAQELGLELAGWLKAAPAQSKQKVKLDGDALQRLKSLGYVQ